MKRVVPPHEAIVYQVARVIANSASIDIEKVQPHIVLSTLAWTGFSLEQVLEILADLYGIENDKESGMAQITVNGIVNYVVCQMNQEPGVSREPPRQKLQHLCNWVL